MSSYLLDTTSNSSVTYGQGKYVASASSDQTGSYPPWQAFDKSVSTVWSVANTYNGSAPGLYTGSNVTVDVLGSSYPGEWLQIQTPVSLLASSYSIQCASDVTYRAPYKWWILGSRDGYNWNLVDQRTNISSWTTSQVQTFTTSVTQAYNYYRLVLNIINGGTSGNIAEWTLNGLEESLCVTSDAKVGVGIANPQRALEVAGDLVVSGTISGGAGMGSFRNRIINGDMRIAQRGTSNVVPSGTSPYLIDHWSVNASGFTTGVLTQYQTALGTSDAPYQSGHKYYANVYVNTGFPVGSVTYFEPGQPLEGYFISDLNWGTSYGTPITVSFWFRSSMSYGSTASFTVQVAPAGYSYASPFMVAGPGVWQYVTATVPPPPNGSSVAITTSIGLKLNIAGFASYALMHTPNTWELYYSGTKADTYWAGAAGNYIHFTGVQLEKGTVATGFEQRPFATELALCQRYYYQWSSTISNGYGSFGFGVQNGFNQVHFITQYPVAMRSNLTSTSSFTSSALSTFAFNSGGGTPGTLNSVTADPGVTTPYTGRFWITTGSAGTAGLSVELRANGSTSAFFGFSAEL
jgi:hypothetical protein